MNLLYFIICRNNLQIEFIYQLDELGLLINNNLFNHLLYR